MIMKRRFLSLAVLELTMAAVLIVFGITETAVGAAVQVVPPNLAKPKWESDITDTSIRLSWSAPLNASQCIVQRKSYGGEYEAVTVLGAGATSYTDTGLKNGTTYYYRILTPGISGGIAVFQRSGGPDKDAWPHEPECHRGSFRRDYPYLEGQL
jgi:hypothetical protein